MLNHSISPGMKGRNAPPDAMNHVRYWIHLLTGIKSPVWASTCGHALTITCHKNRDSLLTNRATDWTPPPSGRSADAPTRQQYRVILTPICCTRPSDSNRRTLSSGIKHIRIYVSWRPIEHASHWRNEIHHLNSKIDKMFMQTGRMASGCSQNSYK